ncbi:unnamed protein product [Lymnaea stagnalis]|uniref:Uncharacterized protein n=1 Tax=Lymnaea stagnalis TaxID=6523 RepID=A0AAV2I3J2_LYMST
MPSPGRGFCLGLRMDGNENIAAATVSTLPLQSHKSTTRAWQGHPTIPITSRDKSYSLDNDKGRQSGRTAPKSDDSIAVDNVTPKSTLTHPSTLVMEPGPVIKMGTGALGQRKGVIHRGDVTSWKEISPKSESSSPSSSPLKDAGKLGGTSLGEGRNKSNCRSPVKSGTGDGIHNANSNVSNSKNCPKRQNSISKSPRPTRKNTAGAKNSNLSTSPKKSSTTSSSSSSFEATSPKRGKPIKPKGHYGTELDTGQLDKVKLADKYKISDNVDISKATTPIIEALNAKLDRGHVIGKSQVKLTTWKDISPTESKIEGATAPYVDKRSRPESGYFSNEVHSESREGMDGSLSSESDHVGTIKHRPKIKKDNQNVLESKNTEDDSKAIENADNAEKNDQNNVDVDQMSCQEDVCVDENSGGNTEDIHNSSSKTVQQVNYNDLDDINPMDTTGVNIPVKQPRSAVTMMEESESSSSSPRHWGNKDSAANSGLPIDGKILRRDLSSVTSMDNSDSFDRSQDQRASQDDSSFNDYFFDEDFIVQFDGNLQSSVGVILQGSCAFSLADSLAPGFPGPHNTQPPGQQVLLPHSFNGSYTAFGALRDSFLQNEDLYSGPCESEVSGTGSRTSMDVSSSEREMMCSSDMLDFPGNEPLFTPPCVTNSQEQNLSTDSLSRQLEGGEAEVTATTSLSGSRSSSTTADITVKCGPHKDAYFLSFDGGSQGKFSTESESSYVSQTSSQDDKLGSRSMSSGGEAEDEQSSSFQFANLKSRAASNTSAAASAGGSTVPSSTNGEGKGKLCTWNMKGSRYPGRICLEALQEYLSQSSGSPGSLSQSAGSHKLSPLCAALLSSGELEKHCAPKTSNGSFIKRSGRLTTWKQIRNLRNLGKAREVNAERSKSLPELATNRCFRGFSEETSDDEEVNKTREATQSDRDTDEAEQSFHHKRHSSYVLDLYQRLRSQSNPPSPDTLAKIDQILLREGFLNAEDIAPKPDQQAHPQQHQQRSCCHSAATSCDSACSSGHYPFYNMCVQRSDIMQKRAQLRAEFERREKLHLDLTSADTATSTVNMKSGCTQTLRSLRMMTSKETLMSPSTVTLWLGTRNFSSQFPPKTQDCGLQTSLEGIPDPQLNHMSQQTSPYTPERDLFSLLEEVCAKYSKEPDQAPHAKGGDYAPEAHEQVEYGHFNHGDGHRMAIETGYGYDGRQCGYRRPGDATSDFYHGDEFDVRDSARSPQKNTSPSHQIHRAASANDCHIAKVRTADIYRTASLSPSRMGLNSYYTHRSLPDLSFLKERRKSFLNYTGCVNTDGDQRATSPDSSLFDPVKIPIILSPIVDVDHTRSHSYSPCRSHSCSPSRRQTVSCCGCPCSPRSQSSPAKTGEKFSKKSKSFNGSPTFCNKQRGSSPLRCGQPCGQGQRASHNPPDLYADHNIAEHKANQADARLKNSPNISNKLRSNSHDIIRDQQTKFIAVKRASSVSNAHQASSKNGLRAVNQKARAVSHSPSCSRLLRHPAPKSASTGMMARHHSREDVSRMQEMRTGLKPQGGNTTSNEVKYQNLAQFEDVKSDGCDVEERDAEGCGDDGSGRSGGSGGFTPTEGGYSGMAGSPPLGNAASSKSVSSTSSSSSSSSSKKVTSGQYVVSCFSSSSASSSKSDQKSSSTSTIESRTLEDEASVEDPPAVTKPDTRLTRAPSVLTSRLQKQSSIESDSGLARTKSTRNNSSKDINSELLKQKMGTKRGRIPVPISKGPSCFGSNSSISSTSSGYAPVKQDTKATSRLPAVNKSRELSNNTLEKKTGKKLLVRPGDTAKPASQRIRAKISKGPMKDEIINNEIQHEEKEACNINYDEDIRADMADNVNLKDDFDIVHCDCGHVDGCEQDQAETCPVPECTSHGICRSQGYGGCGEEDQPGCLSCDCADNLPADLQEILGEGQAQCCHCTELMEEDENLHRQNMDLNPPIIDGRGCIEMPADLEHILFQPPHLESSLERESLKAAMNSCESCADQNQKEVSINGECCKMIEVQVENPPNVVGQLQLYNSLTDMKSSASGNALLAKKNVTGETVHRRPKSDLTGNKTRGGSPHTVVAVPAAHKAVPVAHKAVPGKRVVNESYPVIPRHQDVPSDDDPGNQQMPQQQTQVPHPKRRWSTGSSLNTYNFEALYSLQEESGHSSGSLLR